MSPEEQKRRSEQRRAYREFLARRVGELHKAGYPGRTARSVADYEWSKK